MEKLIFRHQIYGVKERANYMKKTHNDLLNLFAENKCKLLTTEEEYILMYENQVKKNVGHIKFRYTAQCGHENQVFLTNFQQNSGLLCKDCKYKEIAKRATDKAKISTIAGNVSVIEHEGFKICRDLLKDTFEIHRTHDGCKADFMLKPNNNESDLYLGIQLKVCSNICCGLYSFHHLNKNYDDLMILCVCLADKKSWIFDYSEIKHIKRLNIGHNNSKYNFGLVNKDNINSRCLEFYNRKKLFPKDELLVPISKDMKLEHEYRVRREKELTFLKFEYNDMDNAVFDFVINGKKHQEKVISFRKNRNWFYSIQIKRRKNIYKKGDNDYYWIWLNNTKLFLVFPENVLIENGYIGAEQCISLSINLNNLGWKNEFLFDLQNLKKEKLIELIQYDDQEPIQKLEMPIMTIPEPILIKVKEKNHNYCIDCNIEIFKNSTRCNKCNQKDRRKVEVPSKEELLILLSESNYVQVGKMFKVSDNTIRNWLKY